MSNIISTRQSYTTNISRFEEYCDIISEFLNYDRNLNKRNFFNLREKFNSLKSVAIGEIYYNGEISRSMTVKQNEKMYAKPDLSVKDKICEIFDKSKNTLFGVKSMSFTPSRFFLLEETVVNLHNVHNTFDKYTINHSINDIMCKYAIADTLYTLLKILYSDLSRYFDDTLEHLSGLMIKVLKLKVEFISKLNSIILFTDNDKLVKRVKMINLHNTFLHFCNGSFSKVSETTSMDLSSYINFEDASGYTNYDADKSIKCEFEEFRYMFDDEQYRKAEFL